MTSLDPDTPDIFTGQFPAEMSPPSSLATGDLSALVTTIPAQEIVIDWARYLKLRPWVLQHDPELTYLLGPEVRAFIDAAETETKRMLFATLWVSGGRISEVLKLTPAHFHDDPDLGRAIALPTLKKRPRKAGEKFVPFRRVPVVSDNYWSMLRRFLASHRGGQNAPVFQSSRQSKDASARSVPKAITAKTAQRWTTETFEALKESYGPGIDVTPHTFRHSFAVNALIQGRELKTISSWLGHKTLKETERYLQVMSLDTGHLMTGVEYFI